LHALSLEELKFLTERQPNSDARSFPDFAGDLDFASMALDDVTADGQSQAGSMPLPTRKKWLEHTR
jgi:hypothetical protein